MSFNNTTYNSIATRAAGNLSIGLLYTVCWDNYWLCYWLDSDGSTAPILGLFIIITILFCLKFTVNPNIGK